MPSFDQNEKNVNQFAILAINNDSEFTGALTEYTITVNRGGDKKLTASFTCAGVFEDQNPILAFFNGKDPATITIIVTNTLNSSGETTRNITLNNATCLTYAESWDSQTSKLTNLNDLLITFLITADSATIGGEDFPK
jgi:hypothetical protein